MTLYDCPPHYIGPYCDWPVCGINGVVVYSSKTCRCNGNFEGKFCTNCIAGFWGEDCDRVVAPPTDEENLLPVSRIIFVGSLIFFIILLIILFCVRILQRRRKKSRGALDSNVENEDLPPPYDEVIKIPPPYMP